MKKQTIILLLAVLALAGLGAGLSFHSKPTSQPSTTITTYTIDDTAVKNALTLQLARLRDFIIEQTIPFLEHTTTLNIESSEAFTNTVLQEIKNLQNLLPQLTASITDEDCTLLAQAIIYLASHTTIGLASQVPLAPSEIANKLKAATLRLESGLIEIEAAARQYKDQSEDNANTPLAQIKKWTLLFMLPAALEAAESLKTESQEDTWRNTAATFAPFVLNIAINSIFEKLDTLPRDIQRELEALIIDVLQAVRGTLTTLHNSFKETGEIVLQKDDFTKTLQTYISILANVRHEKLLQRFLSFVYSQAGESLKQRQNEIKAYVSQPEMTQELVRGVSNQIYDTLIHTLNTSTEAAEKQA